ncbi:Flp pilus assembly protein CpaB [Rhodobacterales bacterium LSUCC0031]|nr:Flp pilus assembly protein CpaB [Rhodobacterales bacterium LSUCC0031]
MRLIFGLVLFLGIGLAGLAVQAVMTRFNQYQAALAQQSAAIIPTVEVYVASRALRYGEVLSPADVKAIRWPEAYVPSGAFTTLDELFPPGDDSQRTVLRLIETHEPLSASKVTLPGEDAGVAARLADGTRAFTLQIDVVTGVSGFLRTGDRVDVYWTGTGRNGESLTRLIRSGIQIMALDQTADSDRNNPIIARTITFAALPRDIAALTQAQASGRLTLALVGIDDDTEIEMVEVSRDALLGINHDVAEPAAAPRICTVRQRNAGELVVVQVPCTN